MSTICQLANSAVCYWHLKDTSVYLHSIYRQILCSRKLQNVLTLPRYFSASISACQDSHRPFILLAASSRCRYPVLSKQNTKQDAKLKAVILSDIRIPWKLTRKPDRKSRQKSYSHKIFSTTWFAISTGLLQKLLNSLKSRRDIPLSVWSMVLWFRQGLATYNHTPKALGHAELIETLLSPLNSYIVELPFSFFTEQAAWTDIYPIHHHIDLQFGFKRSYSASFSAVLPKLVVSKYVGDHVSKSFSCLAALTPVKNSIRPRKLFTELAPPPQGWD